MSPDRVGPGYQSRGFVRVSAIVGTGGTWVLLEVPKPKDRGNQLRDVFCGKSVKRDSACVDARRARDVVAQRGLAGAWAQRNLRSYRRFGRRRCFDQRPENATCARFSERALVQAWAPLDTGVVY